MSERAVLTLDLGGESQESVEAVQSLAEALASLQEAAGTAGEAINQSLGQVDGAASGAVGAMQQMGSGAEEAAGSGEELHDSLADVASSALEVSPALQPLANALNTTTNAVSQASSALEGGAGALGVFAIAGAAVITVVGGLGEVAGEWANEVMRATAITGLSEEAVQMWGAALEIAGGDASSLSRASLLLQRDMEAASDRTTSQAAAFRQLGVDVSDANGKLRSSGDVLEETFAALGNLTDATERHQAAIDLFGSRYAGQIIPLLDNYVQITGQAAAITEQHSGTLNGASDKAIKYNTEMTRLKEDVREIAVDVLPAFLAVLDQVAGFLDFVAQVVTGVTIGIGALGDVISAILSPLEALLSLGGAVAGAVSDVIPSGRGFRAAAGGPVEADKSFLIGDVFAPAKSSVVLPSNSPGAGGGNTTVLNVTFINQGMLGGQDVTTWLQDGVKKAAQYGLGTRGFVATPP